MVLLLATPWTAAFQAPPSMGFSRQEYWSGVPLPSLIYSACKLNNQGDNIEVFTYSFPNLEPVCCSMSSSNCCFLTYIQVSQEADKVVWKILFKNLPQFIVIHTVKGVSIVNETEVDVFLEFSCFSMIQWMLAI